MSFLNNDLNEEEENLFLKKIEKSSDFSWIENLIDKNFSFTNNMINMIKDIPNEKIQRYIKTKID